MSHVGLNLSVTGRDFLIRQQPRTDDKGAMVDMSGEEYRGMAVWSRYCPSGGIVVMRPEKAHVLATEIVERFSGQF